MLMITATPSSGNPFSHSNATSPGDQHGPSCPHPEWIPLDEIAQTWAGFGAEAHSHGAFQATSIAFLALACETSAHRHYTSSVRGDGRGNSPLLTNTQDIEHAIADLDEAYQQWQSVLLWLDHLARETRQQEELPLTIERLSLLLRVQQEYLHAHHEPLLIFLGYLPSTPEKGGL